jgi:hypothetical protein
MRAALNKKMTLAARRLVQHAARLMILGEGDKRFPRGVGNAARLVSRRG